MGGSDNSESEDYQDLSRESGAEASGSRSAARAQTELGRAWPGTRRATSGQSSPFSAAVCSHWLLEHSHNSGKNNPL